MNSRTAIHKAKEDGQRWRESKRGRKGDLNWNKDTKTKTWYELSREGEEFNQRRRREGGGVHEFENEAKA